MPNRSKVRRGVAGVRGTQACFSGDEVERYTRAFGTFLREVCDTNTFVVGRDTRATSPEFSKRVVDALLLGGWDVIDLGVVPTPTVQLAVHALDAAGGIAITASHNPAEYNGLKFLQNVEGHGFFLRPDQTEQVFGIYDSGKFDERRRGECRPIAALKSEFDVPPYTNDYLSRSRAPLAENAVILDYHLHRVITAMGRDLDMIRARNFQVAMDCCGGAGLPINIVLLDYLYARVHRYNDTPGVFARGIEPIPRNLAGLCEAMRQETGHFDAGFATDCDNDRCVIIARDAEADSYVALEEDYTFGIAVDHVLSTMPPGRTVVTNWTTSQMIKDLCSARHANLRRVPTGEVYTAIDAMHFHATVAGEGSCAGVIDPRVGMGRDVLVAIWHVLATLALRKEGLLSITRSYPRYWQCSRDHLAELPLDKIRHLIESLQVYFAGNPETVFMSREDGLIIALGDHSRLQVRASNTEPLLRVRTSSRDPKKAESLADEVIQEIQRYIRAQGNG